MRNLISWINKNEISGKLKEKIPAKNGTISHLEHFLLQEYPDFDTAIIKRLKSMQKTFSGYPIHKNDDKVLEGYEELNIEWPIDNYSDAWERMLKVFDEILQTLLDTI